MNPYIYGMAFILIALAVVSVAMPSHKSSAYIPVAVLNLDDNEDTEEAVEELCEMGSIFDFYEVDSEAQMYSDLATGKANTGFILPEDLMDKSGHGHNDTVFDSAFHVLRRDLHEAVPEICSEGYAAYYRQH